MFYNAEFLHLIAKYWKDNLVLFDFFFALIFKSISETLWTA